MTSPSLKYHLWSAFQISDLNFIPIVTQGLGVFGEEVLRAARSLASLEWRVIREERFEVTPVGMFDKIVKSAEAVLRLSAGEEQRRQAWLAHDGDEGDDGAAAVDDPGVAAPGSQADALGCDLDHFVLLGGPKPPYWKSAVQIAGWIQVDGMRTFLEIHYDQFHLD